MTTLDEELRAHRPDEVDVDVSDALDRVHRRHRQARRTRIAALGAACVVIVAVGGLAIGLRDDPDTDLATADGSMTSIEDVIGLKWRFDRIEFSDGRPTIELRDRETSLRLTDGRLAVRICNSINGKWSQRESRIVVDQHERTLALCLDDVVAEGEEVFVELLSDPISWTATDHTLKLSAGPITVILHRVIG